MLLFCYYSSGLKQIKWKLGTEHNSSDIGYGALTVEKLDETVTIFVSMKTASINII